MALEAAIAPPHPAPPASCPLLARRLIYWLTFAVGRSFRGFGYGLTFLPLLSMLVWNLYYMFVVEPERMFTATESRLDYPDHARSDYRPRPWG